MFYLLTVPVASGRRDFFLPILPNVVGETCRIMLAGGGGCALVAQWPEQRFCEARVRGSNPCWGTILPNVSGPAEKVCSPAELCCIARCRLL